MTVNIEAPGGRPRYLQLATTLVHEIRSGRYPVGSLLPTEFELCEQFGVSRITDLRQYAYETTLEIEGQDLLEVQGDLADMLDASPGETWLHVWGRRYTEAHDKR